MQGFWGAGQKVDGCIGGRGLLFDETMGDTIFVDFNCWVSMKAGCDGKAHCVWNFFAFLYCLSFFPEFCRGFKLFLVQFCYACCRAILVTFLLCMRFSGPARRCCRYCTDIVIFLLNACTTLQSL